MTLEINRSADITQVVDQLMEVVHELLEIAGQGSVSSHEVSSQAPVFRAEMRRYRTTDEFVDLSEVEALILDSLLQSRGRLVTKTELCQVLGLNPETQERNLKSYVHRLKAKLRRMHNPGVKIQPIHGAGYVLSEVTETSNAAIA